MAAMIQEALYRRVVVTGIGAVTPLGLSFVDTWNSLLTNKNAFITLEETLQLHQNLTNEQYNNEWKFAQTLPCQVVAPVQNFISIDARKTPRFVQFALHATKEAIEQAKLFQDNNINSERIGVSIGTGMSCVREVIDAYNTCEKQGYRKLLPHFVPRVLSNSAAGRISIEYNCNGPNLTSTTACAAASHAIGEAYNCIRNGVADIMITGGTESSIDPLSLAGFCKLRALATSYNDTPEFASRPFDIDRDGFVMGEGSCIIILEEYEHAKQRLQNQNIQPIVELVGYGASADSYHITSPDPNGKGAIQAMRMAINDASSRNNDNNSNIIEQIQYVNAHATSTPIGDEIEAKAVYDALFNNNNNNNNNNGQQQRQRSDDNNNVYISSTKGATGHLLGAAGAIEAGFTIQSIIDSCIPPTKNLMNVDNPNNNVKLNYVQNEPISIPKLDCAISNSFGFGGTNAALVFKRIQS